jgi:group I intron endonuclease
MESGIYEIYCSANDKFYIGQTNNFSRRFAEHKKRLKSKKMKHHCLYLENAWQKYGENFFHFRVIEECRLDKLNEREQYYINLLGKDNLFNIGLVAEAPKRGVKLSEETKNKLSILNSGKNNPNYGKKLSKETRKKISESRIGKKNWQFGKPIEEKTKQKIRDSLKGEKCHLAKLNWNIVRMLRQEYKQGCISCIELAKKYNLNKYTVWDIIKERTWKE